MTVYEPPFRWLSAEQQVVALDPRLHDWLYAERGSLTGRLVDLAAGAFSVRPLAEGWQPLREDECQALHLTPGSQGWVREVFLCGNGQPWVYARSVAGRDALVDSGFALQQLGTRSLGELLFKDPAFTRGALEASPYAAEWLPAAVPHDRLWGRRSCFYQGALAVLVAEVFLPAFWARLHEPA